MNSVNVSNAGYDMEETKTTLAGANITEATVLRAHNSSSEPHKTNQTRPSPKSSSSSNQRCKTVEPRSFQICANTTTTYQKKKKKLLLLVRYHNETIENGSVCSGYVCSSTHITIKLTLVLADYNLFYVYI